MKTAANSLSRNAPCWCGSGKKFKKCHLGKEQIPYSKMNEKPKFTEKLIYIKTEEQIEGIRKSSQLTKKLGYQTRAVQHQTTIEMPPEKK